MAMRVTLNSLIGMLKDVTTLKPTMDNYFAKYATRKMLRELKSLQIFRLEGFLIFWLLIKIYYRKSPSVPLQIHQERPVLRNGCLLQRY